MVLAKDPLQSSLLYIDAETFDFRLRVTSKFLPFQLLHLNCDISAGQCLYFLMLNLISEFHFFICIFTFSVCKENKLWIVLKKYIVFYSGELESQTNRELEEMSKGENIVKWIKGQRISWLGHLERMEEDRMSKNVFTQELKGTRRRGRRRKRWKEEIERDLQVLGVRRWRVLVADRKKWKDIVRQAKAHSGL